MHNMFVKRFLADVDADNYYETIENNGEIYVQEPYLIQCNSCVLHHGYPFEEMTNDQCYEFA